MKKRVKLMLTCLCDSYYGEVGIATVAVLEKLGCEVVFEASQTCCGQPPFNAGDWETARAVAERCKNLLLSGPEPVVAPSASCTAMIREGYPMLFEGQEHFAAFELSEFMSRELGITAVPDAKPYPRKVAYHRACHGRSIGLGASQEMLLASIPELELMPFANPEQCCGFGGAFCATQGKLSSGIGLEKLRTISESGATEIATGDMGCALHLQGLIDKEKIPLKIRHFSEILAEVMVA